MMGSKKINFLAALDREEGRCYIGVGMLMESWFAVRKGITGWCQRMVGRHKLNFHYSSLHPIFHGVYKLGVSLLCMNRPQSQLNITKKNILNIFVCFPILLNNGIYI